MADTKDEILILLRKFRETIEGIIHADKIILFGSYALGSEKEYSDIDIAVVSADINDENYYDLRKAIFRKAMEIDCRMETLCFSKEEFENDWLPIIPEIKRTGVEVL
ncbi:MAG: nucleotidyltransferase domain-containing protein [Candidatus Schekmanbacteria bacterium]|nr:nucleotidyltransferase domain-containing protein [Candidatus Schekmanbacteria bacterium]